MRTCGQFLYKVWNEILYNICGSLIPYLGSFWIAGQKESLYYFVSYKYHLDFRDIQIDSVLEHMQIPHSILGHFLDRRFAT